MINAYLSGADDEVGTIDQLEYSYGTNPLLNDSDGVSDGFEIATGSDPTNPFSREYRIYLPAA